MWMRSWTTVVMMRGGWMDGGMARLVAFYPLLHTAISDGSCIEWKLYRMEAVSMEAVSSGSCIEWKLR